MLKNLIVFGKIIVITCLIFNTDIHLEIINKLIFNSIIPNSLCNNIVQFKYILFPDVYIE